MSAPPHRPVGFVFLAVCSFLCGLAMTVVLATAGNSPSARFAAGATGALALVTAEALAFVRPWAFGASLAFAGSFIAMTFVSLNVDVAWAITAVAILPILIALSMVYNGLRSVAGAAHVPQPTRVPAPRPPRSTLP
jgi:hypothetical protein